MVDSRTVQELVEEFHHACGVHICEDTPRLRQHRADLLEEEAREAVEELRAGTLEDIAQELADVVYIAFGAAVAIGIDLDEAVRRVHAANMTKINEDGSVNYREDGKVLKSDRYQPPSMEGVVKGD